MSLHLGLRLLGLACVVTAAVIGFIDGLHSNPLLYWPWTLPIVGALIAAGLALNWLATLLTVSRTTSTTL